MNDTSKLAGTALVKTQDWMAMLSVPDSERSCLGAVLIAPDLLEAVADVVCPADFRDLSNMRTLEAMLALREKGVALDVVTLAAELAARKADVPASYLAKLMQSLPSALHAADYAKQVREASDKRRIMRQLEAAAKCIYGGQSLDVAADVRAILEPIDALGGEGDFAPVTAAELVARVFPDSPFLLNPWLVRGGLNLIAGDIGGGKTFLSLDLALAVSTGGMAWGRKAEVQGGVLMLCADQNEHDTHDRLRDMCAARGIEVPTNIWLSHDHVNFADRKSYATLRRFIEKHGIALFCIDAAVDYIPADENAAGDVADFMTPFRAVANRTGATGLVVHHLTKANNLTRSRLIDRIRGSGHWIATVDSAVVVITEGPQHDPVRYLTQQKSRRAILDSATFSIRSGENGGTAIAFAEGGEKVLSVTLADMAVQIMKEIMAESEKPMGRKDLEQALDARKANIPAGRTLDKAFQLLGADKGVSIGKQGSRKLYSLKQEELPL